MNSESTGDSTGVLPLPPWLLQDPVEGEGDHIEDKHNEPNKREQKIDDHVCAAGWSGSAVCQAFEESSGGLATGEQLHRQL